jgi:hypothetical protein
MTIQRLRNGNILLSVLKGNVLISKVFPTWEAYVAWKREVLR